MDASQDAAIKLARAREHLKALRQLGLSRDALLALIEEEYSQQQQVQPEGLVPLTPHYEEVNSSSRVQSFASNTSTYSNRDSVFSKATSRSSLSSIITDEKRPTIPARDQPYWCKYWCAFCNKIFSRRFDWKRHQVEFHERSGRYPCPDCDMVFWGPYTFNQHHKSAHECTTCPHASIVVEYMPKRKAYACGFCAAMTVTMERYLDHVVGHFEMGSTKSDWSHSNVIYGLLHQPIIYEAWKEYIAKRKSTFNGRKPMFGWGPASTGRARGFIEGETPGQLQDLLEFFDGTEASAQNIIRTAAAQVHVIMSAEPLSPEASAPPQAQQLLSRRTSNVQTPISVKSEALGLKQPIPSAFKQTIESESQTPRDSGYDEDIDTKEGSNMCRDPPSPQEELRDDMELVKVHPSSHCWTCTPPDEFSTDIVPLQLSGIPIVVPVQTQYPLYAPLVPPPDPHPLFADPTEPVTDKIIDEIFSVYEEALGFYLLINGMLQIIVPGDFDFEHALSHRPREFAGLQVSYIHESLASTASIASQTSLGASRLVAQAEPSTSTAIPTQPISSSTKPSLVRPSSSSMTIGSTVHASVKGSKSRERFEAHVGLMTKAGDKIYVTIPTHLVTDAVRGANPALIPGSTWMKDVQIFSSTRNKELGPIAETFDPEAGKHFPVGFKHDISLVDVSNAPNSLVSNIKAAMPIEWLDPVGWQTIKYNTSKLFLLNHISGYSPRHPHAKSLGIFDSECMKVGQGIFKQQQPQRRFSLSLRNDDDPRTRPETWAGLVSRSLLFRVHPRPPVAPSGTAVCTLEELDDGTQCAKVAGFISFAQEVNAVSNFDLEGKRLWNRLEQGRVAFYGAFQVPKKLRDEHIIL